MDIICINVLTLSSHKKAQNKIQLNEYRIYVSNKIPCQKKNQPEHLRRQNMFSIVTTEKKRTVDVEWHCLCFQTLLAHIFFLLFHSVVNFCILWTILFFVIESKLLDQKPHLLGWHWLLLPVTREFFSLSTENELFFMNTFYGFDHI